MIIEYRKKKKNIKKFKKFDDGVFIFKVFFEFLSYMRFDRLGYFLIGKKKGGDGKCFVCDGFWLEYL